ncbi:MAG TPA: hypothetical protein DCM58_00700 [Desulfovibrio sp.]|nr:hypothetical protein [Desulfovibrio sp.]
MVRHPFPQAIAERYLGHLPDAGHTSGTQRGAGNAAPSHLKNDSFRFFGKKTEKLIPQMKRIF